MLKSKAIEALGGTVALAAGKVGVTYQAVDKWPEVLPPRIADRVLAAIAKERLPRPLLRDLAEGFIAQPDSVGEARGSEPANG